MLVTTQWPLKRAATSPHLSGCVFYGCLESLTELSALCNHFSKRMFTVQQENATKFGGRKENFTNIFILFVCLFVSLLSHFWLIHFFPPIPALSTVSRPLSSSMFSITPETANVGSSYNRMRDPGIGCWFSDRCNCSHWSLTLTFTLTSENLSLYTTLLLVLVLIHLDSNYSRTRCRQSQLRFVLSPLLLHPRLLGTFQSDISLFTLTWPAKHSPNQGWESTQVTPLPPGWCLLLPLE